jgi:phytoene dehydrogenase-like protein
MARSHRSRIVVVGAGINGLVAASYLRRAGHDVVVLERLPRVGGACTRDAWERRGRPIFFPPGASVLGMMQDFVFRETGLARAVKVFSPKHPEVFYFKDEPGPVILYGSSARLKKELRQKCGEQGDVDGFNDDLGKVVDFLQQGFRAGTPPTLAQARRALGPKLTSLWITGSARRLLDHYFTSDRVKLFYAVSVTESGAVSLDEPYTAFTIPLMSSGGVFDGKWGFVKGGIWRLTEELAKINRRRGVRIVTDAEVTAISPQDLSVSYSRRGKRHRIAADKIVIATDPLSAAKLVSDKALIRTVAAKRSLGTSGKLVLIFDRPVAWTDDTGVRDFSSAFQIWLLQDTLPAFERATMRAARGKVDFEPGFLEIYPEGPAMAHFKLKRDYHIISVFFKNLRFGKRGRELSAVRRRVTDMVLAKTKNRDALVKSILLTPRDLTERFLFPRGNIDHVELAAGQTFFDRNYSAEPERSFYQLGRHENVFYCGAGTYPCGSVAGTPGYMCAKEIERLARGGGRRAAQ